MASPDSAPKSQAHPLHDLDRQTVDRLLAVAEPAAADLVDLARLLMRYGGFPGASDLQEDLARLLQFWKLSREELHERTRAIWAEGFRPGGQGQGAPEQAVGSSFDTADQDSP